MQSEVDKAKREFELAKSKLADQVTRRVIIYFCIYLFIYCHNSFDLSSIRWLYLLTVDYEATAGNLAEGG